MLLFKVVSRRHISKIQRLNRYSTVRKWRWHLTATMRCQTVQRKVFINYLMRSVCGGFAKQDPKYKIKYCIKILVRVSRYGTDPNSLVRGSRYGTNPNSNKY